jgi:iron complex outermembrane receptor protein
MKNGIPGSDIVQVRGFFCLIWGRMLKRLSGATLGFLSAISLLSVGIALAEPQNSENKTFTMDTVEVTTERLSEYVKNHPQNVETIERKDIIQRSLLSVEDVLKTMPGVEIHRSSGVGYRISIRGSGKSGGVLVLINGRPLNTNQYGGVDLNTIPVEMIESVTVFKPPVPVWLGPGSSDGAINIVTRNLSGDRYAGKEKTTTITAAAGSFGSVEGSASQIVSVAGGSMMITGAGAHQDGRRDNSDKNDGSFSAYWNRQERNATQYEVNGRYYLSEFGSIGPIDNLTPNARQRYQKGSVDARVSGMLGETGTYSINPYGDVVNLRDRSQSGFTSTLDNIKAGIKLETTWSEKQGLWDLRIGAILEEDRLDHTMTGKHHRTMADLNSQYDRRFGPLTGTVGLRGNYTDDFDFSPGFTSGLGYALSGKNLIKGKVGYIVNLPTFGQLYQTSHGSIDQIRGNPDLDKERIWSYDLGVEHRFGKNRVLQATFFGVETSDLIVSLRGADNIYRPVNIDRARRLGIELTLKYAWEMGFSAEVNAIVQTSRNGETGADLPYTPKVKLKTTMQYTLPKIKTRLEGVVRYESARFSDIEGLASQRLAPFTVVDMKAIQPFLIKGYSGEWFLRIDNVFNTAYESHFGYPDDGIRFATGIQARF